MGGSFNPAHDGHREISLAGLTALKLDEIWWLVATANPLKDPAIYADYEARCLAAQRIADHPQIIISRFEREHDLQYTADTLPALQTRYPQHKFVWLMGADSLSSFHQWRDWEKIAAMMPFVVFNRPGYECSPETSIAAQTFHDARLGEDHASELFNMPLPSWVFISHTDNSTSSTALRAGQNQPDLSAMGTSMNTEKLTSFLDFNPTVSDFRTDVLSGLTLPQKAISPKYFYDATGSELFENITQLDALLPDAYRNGTDAGSLASH